MPPRAIINRKYVEGLMGRSRTLAVYGSDIPGGVIRGKVTKATMDNLTIVASGQSTTISYRRITSVEPSSGY